MHTSSTKPHTTNIALAEKCAITITCLDLSSGVLRGVISKSSGAMPSPLLSFLSLFLSCSRRCCRRSLCLLLCCSPSPKSMVKAKPGCEFNASFEGVAPAQPHNTNSYQHCCSRILIRSIAHTNNCSFANVEAVVVNISLTSTSCTCQ